MKKFYTLFLIISIAAVSLSAQESTSNESTLAPETENVAEAEDKTTADSAVESETPSKAETALPPETENVVEGETTATPENVEETAPETETPTASESEAVNETDTTVETEAETQTATKTNDDVEDTSSDENQRSIWDRYFDFGISVDAALGNNYLGIKDIFFNKGLIELDLNKMAQSKIMPQGLKVNVGAKVSLFSNFNINNVHVGFSTDVMAQVLFLLNRSTIKLLAEGNKYGANPIEFGAGASSFVNSGMSAGFNIKKWRLTVHADYFVPFVMVPHTTLSGTVRTEHNGAMSVKINRQTLLGYSVLPLDQLQNGSFAFSPSMVSDILKQGGLDIGASLSFPVLSGLTVGGYVKSFPIVPARLNYKASIGIKELEILKADPPTLNSGKPAMNVNTNVDVNSVYDGVKTSNISASPKKVFRPLRFAAFVNWKPFKSDMLVLSGLLEFRFMDAVIKNAAGFSVGYVGDIRGTFGPFTPFFRTSFMNELFGQALGFKLNLRAFELDLGVSSESTGFLQSFAGRGVKAHVGLIFGF